MATKKFTGLTAAGTLIGNELLMISQLSTTVTITATTLSAQASDNSYNDSGSGFVAAGFAVGDRVNVSGFTGNAANNILTGEITALTAAKMTIGGTDGDVIVDDAAGESVTISKWVSRRATVDEIVALAGGASGGVYEIPVLATAMTPRSTSGAAAGSSETATNKVMVETLDFDQTTDEFAQFAIPMPKSWNEGTLTAVFEWTAGAAGNVVWAIQALARGNDDPLDTAFGTAVTVTDGVTAAGDLMRTAVTAAMTAGGTPAEGDIVIFQVYRDADNGSDTLAADAKLISVRLFLTTNAADDS